jgi:hypothetical protein
MHLAEAAGCHQILTMVLGEQVDVAVSTRERMYALGAVAATEATPRTTPAESASPPAAQPAAAPSILPEYLSSGGRWRRFLPAAIGIAVVALWLGLILSDPTQSWRIWDGSERPDQQPDSGPIAAAPGGAQAPAPGEPRPGEAKSGERKSGEPNPELAAANGSRPSVAEEPQTPPRAAAVAAATAAASGEAAANVVTAGGPPQGTVMPDAAPVAAAAPTPAGPIPDPAPGAEIVAAPAAAAPVQPAAPAAPFTSSKLLYHGATGVLLRRDEMGDWTMMPRRTLLHPGDELACPEPFESAVQVLDSDYEIVLASGSRAFVLHGSPDAAASVLMDRGRFLFRRSATAPLPDVRPLTLQLGEVSYTLELLSAGSICGLEIIRRPSAGGPERPEVPGFDAAMYLTSGSARLTPAGGGPVTLDPTSNFVVFSHDRPAAGAQSQFPSPDWMSASGGGSAIVAQQVARQFEEAFMLDQPVDATIPALVDDRHPRIAELAAKALALTDDYRGMLRSLSSAHQEARLAGIIGLGVWIRRDQQNPHRLAEELDRTVPDGETARRIERLVWGFSPEDARRPEVSAELVEWLRDPHVGVREAAFLQIRRLTGGQVTYRYQPDGPESQRTAAIRQWESHLHKNGALVETGPTPVEATPAASPPGEAAPGTTAPAQPPAN